MRSFELLGHYNLSQHTVYFRARCDHNPHAKDMFDVKFNSTPDHETKLVLPKNYNGSCAISDENITEVGLVAKIDDTQLIALRFIKDGPRYAGNIIGIHAFKPNLPEQYLMLLAQTIIADRKDSHQVRAAFKYL